MIWKARKSATRVLWNPANGPDCSFSGVYRGVVVLLEEFLIADAPAMRIGLEGRVVQGEAGF